VFLQLRRGAGEDRLLPAPQRDEAADAAGGGRCAAPRLGGIE
jgi:hypothetical protein